MSLLADPQIMVFITVEHEIIVQYSYNCQKVLMNASLI